MEIYGVIVIETMFVGRLVLVTSAKHNSCFWSWRHCRTRSNARSETLYRGSDTYLAIGRHFLSFMYSPHDRRAAVQAIKTQLQEETP